MGGSKMPNPKNPTHKKSPVAQTLVGDAQHGQEASTKTSSKNISTTQPKSKPRIYACLQRGGKVKTLNLEGDLALAFQEITQKGGTFTHVSKIRALRWHVRRLERLYGLRIIQRKLRVFGQPEYQFWLLDKLHSMVEVRT